MQISDTPTDLATLVGGATPTNTSFNPALEQGDFLKLLVTKLANQDPLNPAGDTEFIAQLAQFSELEQAIKTNENLERLAAGQFSLINAQALSLIGREVVVDTGGALSLHEGQANPILVRVPEGAGSAAVKIFDAAGKPVRTLTLTDLASGQQTLVWDGLDEGGNVMPDATYSYEFEVLDPSGEKLEAASFIVLTIQGVNFQGGLPILVSGEQEVPFDAIVEIRGGSSNLASVSL